MEIGRLIVPETLANGKARFFALLSLAIAVFECLQQRRIAARSSAASVPRAEWATRDSNLHAKPRGKWQSSPKVAQNPAQLVHQWPSCLPIFKLLSMLGLGSPKQAKQPLRRCLRRLLVNKC